MKKTIKTWQERKAADPAHPPPLVAGDDSYYRNCETMDLRAYIAELESRVTYLTGFDSAIWLWNDKTNQHVLAIPLSGSTPAASVVVEGLADLTSVRQAIRTTMKAHRLTKVGDGVVEADIAHAVVKAIIAAHPVAPAVVAEGLIRGLSWDIPTGMHVYGTTAEERAFISGFKNCQNKLCDLLSAHPVAGSNSAEFLAKYTETPVGTKLEFIPIANSPAEVKMKCNYCHSTPKAGATECTECGHTEFVPRYPAAAEPMSVKGLPVVNTNVKTHTFMCLSAGGGPSDDDCICNIDEHVPVSESSYPYDALFWAIGDAVKTESKAVDISVKQFVETLASKGYEVTPVPVNEAVDLSKLTGSSPEQGGADAILRELVELRNLKAEYDAAPHMHHVWWMHKKLTDYNSRWPVAWDQAATITAVQINQKGNT